MRDSKLLGKKPTQGNHSSKLGDWRDHDIPKKMGRPEIVSQQKNEDARKQQARGIPKEVDALARKGKVMRIHSAIALSSLCVFLLGCPPKQEPIILPPSSTIAVNEAIKVQRESLVLIDKTAAKIYEDAGEIIDIVEEIYVPEFVEEKVEETEETRMVLVPSPLLEISQIAADIQNQAVSLERETKLIGSQHETIRGLGTSLDLYIERTKKLESELEETRKGAIQSIYKYLSWVFGLGMMTVIGGGITAFFMNRRLGAFTVTVGSIMLAFSAAGTFYLKWLAVFGVIGIGIGILATMGLLIYGALERRKVENNLKVKNEILLEATKDVTHLVEAMKQDLPTESKIAFFGEGYKPGYADIIETRQTRDVIDEIRGKEREINSSYLA